MQQAIKSGRYSSESEVVAEALRVFQFQVHEAARKVTKEEICARIQVGIEQANRGEFVGFTAEEVKAEGRRRLDAELKAKIQVGIDQLDRGETLEFDLKEFLAAKSKNSTAD
jgi:Arc/MetJ-type ribon-helix-helix transcriptional regulator